MQTKAAQSKNKKAQQEIFGFVIIILLVIVIGVIILAFSLQRSMRKPTFAQDIKVSDFMNAIMRYTTSCNNKKLSDVIVMCSNGENCGGPSNLGACDYIGAELQKILNASFPALEYGYLNGYNFTAGSVNIENGAHTGNVAVGFYIIPIPPAPGVEPGTIEARLYLYYSQQSATA